LRTTGIIQQQRKEPRQRSYGKLEAAIAIDATRHAILLAIDHAAIVWREPAVIEGAHGADLVVNGTLATLEAECLAARELTLADTGRDAVLLVDLTLCHVVIAVGHLGLRKSRSAEKYSRCDCDCCEFHFSSSPIERLISSSFAAYGS
jgi:hypothetical protein